MLWFGPDEHFYDTSPENLNKKFQLVTEILHFEYTICLQLDNSVLFCLLTLA